MKKRIFISLGVLGILVVAYLFVCIVASGFNFQAVFGAEERTPASLDYQEKITSLDVDMTSDNLIIKKANDGAAHINYYQSNVANYNISLENGVLKITQKRPWYIIFSFTKSKNLEITLPDALDAADLELSAGSINLSSLSIAELKVQASSGGISMDKVILEKGIIKVSSGSINLNDLQAEELEIGSSSGNINLKNVNTERAAIALSSGNIDILESTLKDLTLKASSGKITTSKLVTNNCDINSSSGSVTLGILTDNPENYRLELSTSSGKITVQGGEYDINSRGYLKTGKGSNLIKVSVSSGNISVIFEE